MNNYVKNNNTLNRKKINRGILCSNCGSKHHSYKQCTDPITSWGIILITFGDLKKPLHDKSIDLSMIDLTETQNRVLVESNNDRMIVKQICHNIKFLMVSRKHSVGYVEFIRGKYRPEKIDQIIYLFKQMMQTEIDKIRNSLTMENGFIYLWNDFWGAKADAPYLINDKRMSKTNYDILKIKGSIDGPELDLKYISSNVTADYSIKEWGFPKGRRNKMETGIECAIREFKEESGYTDSDIEVIHQINPLVEVFTGTNGILYKHIYYVAELISNKKPQNNITESQIEEIGNIEFMDFISALEYIREYHIPRKILLEKIFTYYLDKLILSNRPIVSI